MEPERQEKGLLLVTAIKSTQLGWRNEGTGATLKESFREYNQRKMEKKLLTMEIQRTKTDLTRWITNSSEIARSSS
ncbi:hypothetical protein CARUB_v10021248mg [Capsella rubella]|uniref:Uncharacterized protein n=1 Tax=Capsella rubella TaxID=81985 RepID=R0I1B7_9BRAS|nr:hypothetical protein CARUB_v10021248mg [Capsella rubella]